MKFKPGDRVSFLGEKGAVIYAGEHSLQIKFDAGATHFVSLKDCRRLVKKKPVKKQELTLKETGMKIEPGAIYYCEGVSVYNEGEEAIYFKMSK